jgi:hypothetical protein
VIGFFRGLRFPGRFSQNVLHSGIAALTVGTASGRLEIYGTTSVYMPVFWITGPFSPYWVRRLHTFGNTLPGK